MIRDIVVLGAGRLSRHLAIALFKHGLVVSEIWNRSPDRGIALSALTGAKYIHDISDISKNADVYLCTVSDSAIAETASLLHLSGNLIVHTSGSVPMDVLNRFSENVGVFYPLQTFSDDSSIDFTDIPICIESSSESGIAVLSELGSLISNYVFQVTSDDRRLIHTGAVMVSNFTNYLYTAADMLLKEHHLLPEMLYPLILQTARNATHGNPQRFQTGPAIRDDKSVIDKQLQILNKYPDIKEVYQLLTQKIIKQYSKHGKL